MYSLFRLVTQRIALRHRISSTSNLFSGEDLSIQVTKAYIANGKIVFLSGVITLHLA